MKSIAILGSTGSVGVTTLDVVDRFRDRFHVVAMAASVGPSPSAPTRAETTISAAG